MNLSNNKIEHIKKDDQEFIQFKRLNKYSSILVHCYSVGIKKDYRTHLANGELLVKGKYLNNFKTLCEANNLDYKNIVKARQNHTSNILSINGTSIEYLHNYEDAIITNQKNIILSTTNADCILFLMFDPVKKVIADIHSGWKGTLEKISVKTVETMVKQYGCNPRDIIVCICPSIRKCHFEVDKDVYDLYFKEFKNLGKIEDFIVKKGNKWHIDTVLINKIMLKNIGILEENIEDSNICSVCNKEIIHSYRAEGKNYGLETALIVLK